MASLVTQEVGWICAIELLPLREAARNGLPETFNLTSTRAVLVNYRRRREAARQVSRELRAMTDAELNELGISRTAIRRLAREAAAQVR